MGLVNLCEDAHASLILRFLTYLRNEIVAAVQTLFFCCPPKASNALSISVQHVLGTPLGHGVESFCDGRT